MYIRRIADVDLTVLEQLIAGSVAQLKRRFDQGPTAMTHAVRFGHRGRRPRQPRPGVPDIPHSIPRRGNNRPPYFLDEDNCAADWQSLA